MPESVGVGIHEEPTFGHITVTVTEGEVKVSFGLGIQSGDGVKDCPVKKNSMRQDRHTGAGGGPEHIENT